MRINVDFSALRRMEVRALIWRFVLGAAITGAASIAASLFGASVGGLFLAFPAILPLSLTLVANDQQRRKEALGRHGVRRGREAAALDALGATLGSSGLFAFALTVSWFTLRNYRTSALLAATMAWVAVATAFWWMRKH